MLYVVCKMIEKNMKENQKNIGSSQSVINNKSDRSIDSFEVTLSYEKPVLTSYGDVRDITLGGSPGLGESGSLPSDPRRPL